MSFYSYIEIFRPGPPMVMSLQELRALCDTLRNAFALSDSFQILRISYQRPTDSWNDVSWDETGTIATNTSHAGERAYDHAKDFTVWQEAWPDQRFNDKAIWSALVGLGSLPEATNLELALADPVPERLSYISPTEMSVSIGPVELGTLTAELPEEECYGYMSISFSGYGYFSWQPLATYWKAVRQSASIQKALQMCKETLPASPQVNLIALKERLGEMFLNQEDYRIGDWIVSVSESG